jgi:hypothetical protein
MIKEFETYATFYKSSDDLTLALNLTTEILKEIATNPDSQLKEILHIFNDKMCRIEHLATYIKNNNQKLNYLTRDHIIELFFKDRERRLMIVDHIFIYYRKICYVQPPDTLYFGTVQALINKIKDFGIKSHTKGFIRLYDTIPAAKNFAKQFANRQGDVIVVFEVDAMQAFTDGNKFSTHEPGEFIVAKIEKEYVKGLVKSDENIKKL